MQLLPSQLNKSRFFGIGVMIMFVLGACMAPFDAPLPDDPIGIGTDTEGVQASGNVVIRITGDREHTGHSNLTSSTSGDASFRYEEIDEVILEVRHHRTDENGVRYLLAREQFSVQDFSGNGDSASVSVELEAMPIVTDVRVDAFGYAGDGAARGVVAFGSQEVYIEPNSLSHDTPVPVNIFMERRRTSRHAFTASPAQIIMPPALLSQAGTGETYQITIVPTVDDAGWPTNPAGQPDETVRITAILEASVVDDDGEFINSVTTEAFVDLSYSSVTAGDSLEGIVLTVASPTAPPADASSRSVAYTLRMWPSFGVVQEVENLPALPVMTAVRNIALTRDGSDHILSWDEPAFAAAAGRWVQGYELSRRVPGEEDAEVVVLDTSAITRYRWVGGAASAATYFIRPRGGESIFGPAAAIESEIAQVISVENWAPVGDTLLTFDPAPHTNPENLWRITEDGALAFNDPETNTYSHPDNGTVPVAGSVIAGPFDLRRFENPTLAITTRQVTENGSEGEGANSLTDQRLIHAGVGTATAPPTVWESLVDVATPDGFAWAHSFDTDHTYTLSLQNMHGAEAVFLKFTFDSIDDRNNDHLGWIINNLTISDGAVMENR